MALTHYALPLGNGSLPLATLLNDNVPPPIEPDTYLLVSIGAALVNTKVVTKEELKRVEERMDFSVYYIAFE